MQRPDGRAPDALRPVTLQRHYTKFAEGSVLVSFGDTKVLCNATVADRVPSFLRDTGRGWVTAEYNMLPRCAQERISRDAVKRGRSLEISRLIGRALRCAVDLSILGERQITIDCDVIQADGGTRCAAITGGYAALYDAVRWMVDQRYLPEMPPMSQCAAVSVGIVDGSPLLDLCYEEDFKAGVDMNVAMCEDGRLIEVQGSGEEAAFTRAQMDEMMEVAEKGIRQLFDIQKKALQDE